MRTPINKYGNFEIEQNILKYRLPIEEVGTEDITVIEKNFKRKVKEIETSPYYIYPIDIQIVNSSLILFYELIHYKSFDYLRQLTFYEKIKYFTSFVEIAKNQEHTKILWDRFNFVVDTHQENLKAILFETEDIKIYEETDALEGAKKLILMSMTYLNKIIGKPKRADFIEQQEDIIHFAEVLLKIDNLQDLEDFIYTKRIEYEHGQIPSGNSSEKNEKKESVKSFSIPKILRSKNKKTKKKPVLNNPHTFPKKANNKKKIDKMYIFGGIAIVIGIVLNMGVLTPPEKASTTAKNSEITTNYNKENSPNVTDPQYHEQLLEAYRYSLINENEKAISILESIGYENLSDEDRKAMLNIYESAEQYHKIIDLEPDRAKDLVNQLVANSKFEELKKIKENMVTSNPYVDFEVAYLNENYELVIKLQDQVELTGRREQQILTAYIQLKKYEEGKKFAEKVGNPLLLDEINSYLDAY